MVPVWPTEKTFTKRLLAKRLVEVPEVKERVERVVRPEATESVPVKEAAEEIV